MSQSVSMEVDTPTNTSAPAAASSSPSAAATPAMSNFDYCMAEAQHYKEAGNAALIGGNFSGAIGKYLKVQGCTAGLSMPPGLMASQEISLLAQGSKKQPLTPQQEQTLQAFLITVHLNMSQAYLKLQQWSKAAEYATKVLSVDQRNVKALFRRGAACLNARQHFQQAIQDLTLANQLAPQDSLIAQHLQQAKKCEADEQAATDRQLRQSFKGLFSNNGQQ